MKKPRIRYTSTGWYRHWLSVATGTVHLPTGCVFPDHYGLYSREFWVGPYMTATEACSAACLAASAIEAQRAETPQSGSVHESAIPKGDAHD